MIRVVVIDDHPVVRAGVADAIRDAHDLELLGEANDGLDGLELIRAARPDVALVDLRMPKLDGLGLLRALRNEPGRPHILLFSASEEPETVRAALEAGAAGFLRKDEPDRAIVAAIRRAITGDTVVSADLQVAVVAHLAGRSGAAQLSDAELKAITLVARGRSNPEIAQELFVSTATVKSYLARAFDKLGVEDRAAAAAEAVRRGLIS